jgi:hypothetical protein
MCPDTRFEYMAYEFKVRRRTGDELVDKFQAVLVFQSETFPPLIDGSTVPPERWEEWIPMDVKKKSTPTPVIGKLGTPLPGGKSTIPIYREFRVDKDSPFEWEFTIPANRPIPIDNAGLQVELERDIRLAPQFDQAFDHAYNKRVGYKDTDVADGITLFMRGYKWMFTPKKSDPRTFTVLGTRVEYTVLIPITDAAGNLVFNFYPNTGASPVRDGLVVQKNAFFEVV